MKTRSFSLRSLLVVSLAVVGCGGGGTPVEDQERFQLDRSAESGTATMIRSNVDALKAALGGEGIPALQNELQAVSEDMEGIDTSGLSEEAQAAADQIKTLVGSLQGVSSRSEAQETIAQMEELAKKLPE